jgi:hypothetical protein
VEGKLVYLVCYYGAAGGARVCCNHDAAVEETAHNSCSRACRLWQRHALGVEGCIAVVVGEVEAGHGVVRLRETIYVWGVRRYIGASRLVLVKFSSLTVCRHSRCVGVELRANGLADFVGENEDENLHMWGLV